LTATNPKNKIPFYCRETQHHRINSVFATTRITDSWLTSSEVDQLRTEGWMIKIHESYSFSQWFKMDDYVDRLEVIRTNCAGGPSGPTGTMIKAIGNHSYGKTVEQNEPVNYLLTSDPPTGYVPCHTSGDIDPLEHIYMQPIAPEDVKIKPYHQPHIGAFITAHVRMELRRAALLAPDAWLYADTDCVVFSEDVTDRLDIDAKRYGAWKIEESGTEYQIIAKKVYVNKESGEGIAKGLHVKKLDLSDFQKWYEGKPPIQSQVQRNNFLKVLQGKDMFRHQRRKGTAVNVENRI